MVLTLEVVGEQAQALGAERRKVFHRIGGTIGRLPDNDWVFGDPYISGRHALIRYVNGKYFIEDTSTNGVFVNAPDARIARDQPVELNDGDRVFIDTYEIRVSIEEDPASHRRKDPFELASVGRGPPVENEDRTASLVARAEPDDDEEDAPLEEGATEWMPPRSMENRPATSTARENATHWLAGDPPPRPSTTHHPRAHQDRTHWLPAGQAPANATPQAKPPASLSAAADSSAPMSARSQASTSAGPAATEQAQFMRELLTSAGIEGLPPSKDTAQVLGQMLRIAVDGVMEALRARDQLKQELHMRGTSFKSAHNNPLKFSANVEDAFHNLLLKRNPAYLQPVPAFEDAFRDIRDHQTAVRIAMRVAFEAVLAQFDPVRLQEDFDRQLKKGSILGVPAKLRYWDLFREKYGALVKDGDASFRTLFGEEFARAYEEQLARSKHS